MLAGLQQLAEEAATAELVEMNIPFYCFSQRRAGWRTQLKN
jgi:hypothetical protein